MPVIGLSADLQSSPGWQEQIQSLLNTLDAAQRVPIEEARRAARLTYRSLEVCVEVLNIRGEVLFGFCVPTRNISATGIAFLHKQMLTPGAKLHVDIPLLDERSIKVCARVMRCRHITGMVHEVGVEFLYSHAAD
jgi:hypothetical protein